MNKILIQYILHLIHMSVKFVICIQKVIASGVILYSRLGITYNVKLHMFQPNYVYTQCLNWKNTCTGAQILKKHSGAQKASLRSVGFFVPEPRISLWSADL